MSPVEASEHLKGLLDGGELDSMTLLEASELVKGIEETFDVDTSVDGVMMAAPMAGGAVAGGDAPAAEEKTEFDLVLASFPQALKPSPFGRD